MQGPLLGKPSTSTERQLENDPNHSGNEGEDVPGELVPTSTNRQSRRRNSISLPAGLDNLELEVSKKKNATFRKRTRPTHQLKLTG